MTAEAASFLDGAVATFHAQKRLAERAIEQLSHYGYHVGQIVLTARLLVKDGWRTVTIPRGGSEEYNKRIREQNGP